MVFQPAKMKKELMRAKIHFLCRDLRHNLRMIFIENTIFMTAINNKLKTNQKLNNLSNKMLCVFCNRPQKFKQIWIITIKGMN